jgi:hypothetical protein
MFLKNYSWLMEHKLLMNNQVSDTGLGEPLVAKLALICIIAKISCHIS